MDSQTVCDLVRAVEGLKQLNFVPPPELHPIRALAAFAAGAKAAPAGRGGLWNKRIDGDPIVADVLLVEDEALIRMMTADMVQELGLRVTAEAGNLKDAEALAQSALFDLAILDINIAGESIFPIALIVEQRGLPLLFASGYTTSGLPEPFCQRSVLRKPFAKEELGRAIDALLGA
jgi:CheY-like chemotaxis protein